MMIRFAFRTMTVLLFCGNLALVPHAPAFAQGTSVGADSDDSFDPARSGADSSRSDNSRQTRLHDDVLEKLRDMKRSSSADHDETEQDHENDWYVVGGALTNRRTGRTEFNFNTFQGAEDVAGRIVDFHFGNHGSHTPSWHVFDRFGDAEAARASVDDLVADYQRAVAREDRLRRQQQAAARSRSRRGGC